MKQKLENRLEQSLQIDVNVTNLRTQESGELIADAFRDPDWKNHDLVNHGVTPSRSVEITVDSLQMISKLKQLHKRVWK